MGSSTSSLGETRHPAPYTLHPTPYTLHPTPYTLVRGCGDAWQGAYRVVVRRPLCIGGRKGYEWRGRVVCVQAGHARLHARFHHGESFWKRRFWGSPIRFATKFTTHLLWDVTRTCTCVVFFIEISYFPEILAAMRLSSLAGHRGDTSSRGQAPIHISYPHILHPTPHTLHHTPYILHPSPYS